MCCENIFNDEIAQRPPQFHEKPWEFEEKNPKWFGRGKKKREILEVQRRAPAEGGSGGGGSGGGRGSAEDGGRGGGGAA